MIAPDIIQAALHSWQSAALACAWGCFALVWIIGALHGKRTAKRESRASRVAHLAPLCLSFIILCSPPRDVHTGMLGSLGACLTVVGVAIAVWARVVLGGNWSATVTQKAGHELIRTGPFAWVRHPIYTGLLLAILGTGCTLEPLKGLIAFAIALLSLWRKLRLEEQFMIALFGERYLAYQREVPALIPFL